MVRTWSRAGALVASTLFLAVPASAQVVQSVQFGLGGFFPRGVDSRVSDDVLLRNLLGEELPADPLSTDALVFRIEDFRSGLVFGEWTISFDPHIEFGLGASYHSSGVPTVYRDIVDENFFDIPQKIQLRVFPLTGVVRFLPVGRPGEIQPYVGAGISALNYRYSETGDFVDPVTLDIFSHRYVKTGTTLGGVLLGGIRFPIKGDIYALTFEGRYQFGAGDTGGADNGFVADKIDLSGGQFNVGFLIRF